MRYGITPQPENKETDFVEFTPAANSAATNPFTSAMVINQKQGGANEAGGHGGIGLALLPNGSFQKVLFKRDPRISKVLGESIAGDILNDVYQAVDHDSSLLARVSLVKAYEENKPPIDETGKDTYLNSIFIENYKGDLWDYAYKIFYRDQYLDLIASTNQKKYYSLRFTYLLKQAAEKEYRERAQALGRLQSLYNKLPLENRDKYEAKLHELIAKEQKALNDLSIEKYNSDKIAQTAEAIKNRMIDPAQREALAAELAIAKVNTMKRPSGAFSPHARKIVSALIRSNERFKDEFAHHCARRLWLKDLGLHNANFGISCASDDYLSKANEGHAHIVSLDYGAAGCRLGKTVDPYAGLYSDLPFPDNLYKNHFLEYDNDLITSPEIVDAYLKIGRLSPAFIKESSDKAIDKNTAKLGLDPIKRYCQRINMSPADYSNINDRDVLIANLKQFSAERYISRAASLKEEAYGLLLEHAIRDNGRIQEEYLQNILRINPEIYQYAVTKFKQRQFVIAKNVSYFSSGTNLKQSVIQAVIKFTPPQENLSHFVKVLNYYNKQAELGFYSEKSSENHKTILANTQKVANALTSVREKDELLSEPQRQLLKRCDDKIRSIHDYCQTTTAPADKKIGHFSDKSVVIRNATSAAELQQAIQEKVTKWLQRGQQQAGQPPAQSNSGLLSPTTTTDSFSAGHSARINRIAVDTPKAKKPVTFISVQQTKPNGFRSDFYFDRTAIDLLDQEGCLIIAAKEITNFRLANPNPEKPLVLVGNIPKKILEAMIDYCAAQRAKGEPGFDVINRTKTYYQTTPKRLKELEARLKDKADIIFGDAKELATPASELQESLDKIGFFKQATPAATPTPAPTPSPAPIAPSAADVTLEDGNCAFNAFILSWAQPAILHSIESYPADLMERIGTALQLTAAQYSTWPALREQLIRYRNEQPALMQQRLAPLFRQFATEETRADADYFNKTVDALLAAFTNSAQPNEANIDKRDDIYSPVDFIKAKFDSLLPANDASRAQLRDWWQREGKDRFITAMAKNSTYVGDIELDAVARHLNVSLTVTKPGRPGVNHSLLFMRMREEYGSLLARHFEHPEVIKQQLEELGVIAHTDAGINTWPLLKLTRDALEAKLAGLDAPIKAAILNQWIATYKERPTVTLHHTGKNHWTNTADNLRVIEAIDSSPIQPHSP